MNPRHIAMGAALLLAAGLVLFGDNSPDSGVAEAVERAPAAAGVTVVATARAEAPKTGSADTAILAMVPRAVLIGEGDEAMGAGADVFGQQNWTPPPPPPPPQSARQKAPPPPPPMAPPLPFTYLGKAAADGQWEVYLALGDKTYVVRDKMVLDGTYRVDAIAPPNLTLTYLPLNQVQQLNIGVLD